MKLSPLDDIFSLAATMTDPAEKAAKARRDAGIPRILEQVRRPDADPSLGGCVGYPEWFRELELSRAARGEETTACTRSLRRWNTRGTERFRMTGNSERSVLVGVDQFWLCFFMFLFPEASADETCVFVYDNTGSVYNRKDVSERLQEMKYTKKRGSTEAYQAFLPHNVLRHELFWSQPPPLGSLSVLGRR